MKKPSAKTTGNGQAVKAEKNGGFRAYLLKRWPDAGRAKIAPALRALAVPIAKLTPDPMNARLHPENNIEAIMESLACYGQLHPITVRREGMVVMAGNGRLEAAKRLGWREIAATVHSMTDAEAAGFGVADNRTAETALWDFAALQRLEALAADAGLAMPGWTLDELAALRALTEPVAPLPPGPSRSERFLVPPFSVLDARQGYWQDRKRAWIALGIQSELGRGDTCLYEAEQVTQPGLN